MADHENYDNDGWMSEGAEYSPKSEFSKPKVVEEAVTRCVTLRAKEMKKGYYNTTYSKEGLPLKQWIEDSRKAYCSSVQALKILLMPEILTEKADEELKDYFKDIPTAKTFLRYAYHIPVQENVDGRIKYKKGEKFYMPEVDAVVMVRKVLPNGVEQLVPVAGFWNDKIDAYWQHMVLLNDKLLEQLMSIIHRLNYFKSSINFG